MSGRATHPGIGVLAVTVTAEMSTATGLARGALVQQVVPGLGAAQAGIRPGDVITGVAGTSVTSVDQRLVAIRGHNPGDTIALTSVRNGARQTTNVVVTGT